MMARASASVMVGGGNTDCGAGMGGGADAANAPEATVQNANPQTSKTCEVFISHSPQPACEMCTKSPRGESSGFPFCGAEKSVFLTPVLLNGARRKLFPRAEMRLPWARGQ